MLPYAEDLNKVIGLYFTKAEDLITEGLIEMGNPCTKVCYWNYNLCSPLLVVNSQALRVIRIRKSFVL